MKSAINKASMEATRYMGAHVRSEARKSGWPEDVVRSLSVAYTKDGFQIKAPQHHHSVIGDLEYGTPEQSPTAVMHRVKNRTAGAEKFLIARLNEHLGGSYDLPAF